MESLDHITLKRFAVQFLLSEGFVVAGQEVRCPGSRYRVDAAGYRDRIPWPAEETARGETTLWAGIDRRRCEGESRSRACEPRTIIIECKASRSDFIRDDRSAEELIALRDEAERWKRHLEEKRIKVCEPELRESGSALFAEMESWDFASSRLSSYRALLRRIRRIEARLYGETKFCLMARHRLADQLFLITPVGLLRKRETPPGWGLIEVSRRAFPCDAAIEGSAPAERNSARSARSAMNVAVDAPHLASPGRFRERLLRNIAVAATRAAFGPRCPGREGIDAAVVARNRYTIMNAYDPHAEIAQSKEMMR